MLSPPNFSSLLLPANHLSPQALKWREYRRKNPLGPPGLSGSLDRRPQEARLVRRNPIFEFPGSFGTTSHLNCRLNGAWPRSLVYPGRAGKDLGESYSGFSFPFFPGQIAKPLSLTCPDLQDPFSLTEKPPAEFCLSPDGNSEAISIDILQKKGTHPHPAWGRDPAIHAGGAWYPTRILQKTSVFKTPNTNTEH